MPRIVTCGIPRSGSTVVWQILRDLVPDQAVPKLHGTYTAQNGELVVLTVRSPHDIAASLYRVRLSRGGVGVDGPAGLEIVLNDTRAHFRSLGEMVGQPHVLLRYEEFYCDFDVIFDAIAGALGIEIGPEVRADIGGRYTLERNRERAAKFADFNEFDADGIHGDHIGPVLPGSWMDTVPAWGWDQVEMVCDPIAKEWDYAN